MPRGRPTRAESPGILVAQLDGRARRLLREEVDRDTCVAELAEITTDPAILGRAAGVALGSWQATASYDSDRVARMLSVAGADEDVRDQVAAETVRRLSATRGRSGIGNP